MHIQQLQRIFEGDETIKCYVSHYIALAAVAGIGLNFKGTVQVMLVLVDSDPWTNSEACRVVTERVKPKQSEWM